MRSKLTAGRRTQFQRTRQSWYCVVSTPAKSISSSCRGAACPRPTARPPTPAPAALEDAHASIVGYVRADPCLAKALSSSTGGAKIWPMPQRHDVRFGSLPDAVVPGKVSVMWLYLEPKANICLAAAAFKCCSGKALALCARHPPSTSNQRRKPEEHQLIQSSN